MEESTMLILDPGVDTQEIAETSTCCVGKPQVAK